MVEVLPNDEHNQRLVANAHPPDWVNPTAAGRYHLVVIGAGTAGLVAAAGSAGLGAKVALIERHLMGGDCLNVGCVPSKALISAARLAAHVRDGREFGVEVPHEFTVHFSEVMRRMRRLRAKISPADSVRRFQGLGVDVYLGDASFVGDHTIAVAGQELEFRRAVIATGGRAAETDVEGLAEIGYLTNETVFSLTELPSRLAVIGAGPIGCELAQSFARFNSRVTLLSKYEHIMPREDPDAAAIVEASLGRDGVAIVPSCRVMKAWRDGNDSVLLVREPGGEREVRVDAVLVAAGRVANVEGLNLDQVGVRHCGKGVEVDDRLRTTNPHIYASGDVCSRFKFTHAADALSRIVIKNALFHGRAKASDLLIPWCTYTDPEIAHVGLYEHQAKEKGIELTTFTQKLEEVDRSILEGADEGFVRVHCRKGTDKILGATIVADHAGDLISELTLAMMAGRGLGTIAQTIHPYPTQAEAIKKLGDAYNRTKLTPLAKKLFGLWFKWTA
ncbi:Mercuric reductase [Planctomycetes bacterium Pan216]|uniref:Mercuric reductase n=1 Tax=Kolteria novifilia TaxID=2527975 RepID=A0A518B6V5_9BACT|nr:Mercuric reductase [Planctomycetes bacterium Pan216]